MSSADIAEEEAATAAAPHIGAASVPTTFRRVDLLSEGSTTTEAAAAAAAAAVARSRRHPWDSDVYINPQLGSSSDTEMSSQQPQLRDSRIGGGGGGGRCSLANSGYLQPIQSRPFGGSRPGPEPGPAAAAAAAAASSTVVSRAPSRGPHRGAGNNEASNSPPPVPARSRVSGQRPVQRRSLRSRLRSCISGCSPLTWMPGWVAVLLLQLLATSSLVTFYYVRFSGDWDGPVLVRLSAEGKCEQNETIILDETIKFVPIGSTIGRHFEFNEQRHSVQVLTAGSYRISTRICFQFVSNQQVTLSVFINGESWIRCQLSQVEPSQSGGESECCTLFSIRSMRRGDSVSVRIEENGRPAKLHADCGSSQQTSLTLERR